MDVGPRYESIPDDVSNLIPQLCQICNGRYGGADSPEESRPAVAGEIDVEPLSESVPKSGDVLIFARKDEVKMIAHDGESQQFAGNLPKGDSSIIKGNGPVLVIGKQDSVLKRGGVQMKKRAVIAELPLGRGLFVEHGFFPKDNADGWSYDFRNRKM